MPVDRWVDLAREFGEPSVPEDLREQVERRVARLQAQGAGATWWSPRWSSMGRWVAAGVGVVLVVAALGLAAHSRQQSSTPAQSGHVEAKVVLVAQRGRYGNGRISGWHTTGQARVVCGAHPGVTSSAGNNGIRPSDLCRALAYYPAHSTESRCSYTSITGPVVPRRVLVTGTINGKSVHLTMGMICSPPAELGQMTGLIRATVFGYPDAVKASISENTFGKLTEIAQREAQALGDPKVHSATVVLTTRRRMNSALGFGTQPTKNQDAKVFVIQLLGRFTCDTCSYPAGGQAPTGSAAQDVLSYGALSGTDFGLTPHAVVMQRMGPVMHLTWQRTTPPPDDSTPPNVQALINQLRSRLHTRLLGAAALGPPARGYAGKRWLYVALTQAQGPSGLLAQFYEQVLVGSYSTLAPRSHLPQISGERAYAESDPRCQARPVPLSCSSPNGYGTISLHSFPGTQANAHDLSGQIEDGLVRAHLAPISIAFVRPLGSLIPVVVAKQTTAGHIDLSQDWVTIFGQSTHLQAAFLEVLDPTGHPRLARGEVNILRRGMAWTASGNHGTP